MNGYKAFWRGKTCEVYALTSYEAQLAAAKVFKAKKSYEVSVVICERADGSTVTHSTAAFG
jgi:hypothetical protein